MSDLLPGSAATMDTVSSATAGPWAGLDIGGSKVHAVVVDSSGAVLAEHRAPSRAGSAGVLATAVEALHRVARDAGVTAGQLGAVGVGVPGLVDPTRGGVSHAVNLGLDGDGVGLREHLAALTGAAVVVENDVNAAALGASAALGRRDLAYLSIGTGVAAGLVLDGRLRRGARGAAGEVGHLPLDPAGPVCSCGQRGCLEVLASGSAVARAWPGRPGPAAEALFDAADTGDPTAVAVREQVLGHLAAAVRVLVLTVDVEVVVLGGGVAELGERLAGPLRERLARLARASGFLEALDLPGRVRTLPPGRPVAALGAALVGRAAVASAPPVPAPAAPLTHPAAVVPVGGV